MSRFKQLLETVSDSTIQFIDKSKRNYPPKYQHSILDYRDHEPTSKDQAHHDHLYDYTVDSSELNRNLWKNAANKTEVDNISALLKSAPPAKKDLTVYTGVGNKRKDLTGDKHIPAFTSSTPDIHVAGWFARVRGTTENLPDKDGNIVPHTVHHIVKIHIKKGQHVGAFIASHSQEPSEQEFLINKNHTLHFDGTHEDHIQDLSDTHRSDEHHIFRIHNATITPHE